MNTKNTIPSLEKALSLLEYLGKCEKGATQQALARELDITPSTCYRILQTLQKKDWVRRQTGNTYTVSGGILMAAMKLVSRMTRFESAQPVLDRLAAQTGLSCKLSIRQGNDQVTVLRAESPRPVSISGKVGTRFPVIEGSVGAVLLCHYDTEEVLELAETCREDIIEKASPKHLLDMIQTVQTQGYCMNSDQNRWRVSAMSAPISSDGKEIVAALTLLGFSEDFKNIAEKKLPEQLLKSATECAKLAF